MQKLLYSVLTVLMLVGTALAQERFSLFVPSEQENVDRMLKLANLQDDDVVVDLGSGDGRVVLTAARMNPKVRGWGVDIDAKLVAESNANARNLGVADRVRFMHQNAFDTDLREATIVAMWFWPEMQRMLRPVLMARMRPGTRIVTNIWDLGSWPPDRVDNNGQPVSLWIVPARVEGNWSWELAFPGRKVPYAAVVEQRFQTIEGVARAGNRREVLHDARLIGEDVAFTLGMTVEGLGFVRHEFRGKVMGDSIEGTARVMLTQQDETIEIPWRATRTESSAYFEPTGTNLP